MTYNINRDIQFKNVFFAQPDQGRRFGNTLFLINEHAPTGVKEQNEIHSLSDAQEIFGSNHEVTKFAHKYFAQGYNGVTPRVLHTHYLSDNSGKFATQISADLRTNIEHFKTVTQGEFIVTVNEFDTTQIIDKISVDLSQCVVNNNDGSSDFDFHKMIDLIKQQMTSGIDLFLNDNYQMVFFDSLGRNIELSEYANENTDLTGASLFNIADPSTTKTDAIDGTLTTVDLSSNWANMKDLTDASFIVTAQGNTGSISSPGIDYDYDNIDLTSFNETGDTLNISALAQYLDPLHDQINVLAIGNKLKFIDSTGGAKAMIAIKAGSTGTDITGSTMLDIANATSTVGKLASMKTIDLAPNYTALSRVTKGSFSVRTSQGTDVFKIDLTHFLNHSKTDLDYLKIAEELRKHATYCAIDVDASNHKLTFSDTAKRYGLIEINSPVGGDGDDLLLKQYFNKSTFVQEHGTPVDPTFQHTFDTILANGSQYYFLTGSNSYSNKAHVFFASEIKRFELDINTFKYLINIVSKTDEHSLQQIGQGNSLAMILNKQQNDRAILTFSADHQQMTHALFLSLAGVIDYDRINNMFSFENKYFNPALSTPIALAKDSYYNHLIKHNIMFYTHVSKINTFELKHARTCSGKYIDISIRADYLEYKIEKLLAQLRSNKDSIPVDLLGRHDVFLAITKVLQDLYDRGFLMRGKHSKLGEIIDGFKIDIPEEITNRIFDDIKIYVVFNGNIEKFFGSILIQEN